MSLTNNLRFPQYLVIAYFASSADDSLLDSPVMDVFATRSDALIFIHSCDEIFRDSASLPAGSYPVYRIYHLTRSKF